MFQLKIFSSWLIFLSVLRHSYPITGPDVEGEALIEFLRALNDSNNQIKDWNSFFVSPCYSWSNVDCSNKHVISLNLASKGFSGTLSPSIAKLKYLVSLYVVSVIDSHFFMRFDNSDIVRIQESDYHNLSQVHFPVCYKCYCSYIKCSPSV
ncbi:probable leucine-rich repeat receptor-like protein kinase At5g63930 [Arachis ipaensis]|uniref:probable leucine-rich repeat receptor-like protein kinase At5g63930 n=1 Tax=Arachis ipaensis TaxID=130454 RepID=UPI000A2B7A51|nr:probable leucine-rich repeat receptor-like protein kinase At5g63930 [Arachis ipaensis]